VFIALAIISLVASIGAFELYRLGARRLSLKERPA
jgi:hypothetical protein